MLEKGILVMVLFGTLACYGASAEVQLNPLTPEEQRVIIHKGTEPAFSGQYDKFHEAGTYTCKQCGAPLYRSRDKFDSGCGWPSFDDEIPGAVRRQSDADGMRTEILCARCGGHLGHVFLGERLTPKNTRHCVNSISMNFVPDNAGMGAPAAVAAPGEQPPAPAAPQPAKAVFAGGCFWGVQYFLEKAPGVLATRVGYTGGHQDQPTYQQVCRHNTGHYEAVEVTYDPSQTTYENLAKVFFETHDPTQPGGQGPDIGQQYESVIFYADAAEKATAQKLIGILKQKGYRVVTKVLPAQTFWPAEDYHQQYYDKNGHTPYCHTYTKRF
jgi:peptide methionine sulfoxide reductase msrA/msrB